MRFSAGGIIKVRISYAFQPGKRIILLDGMIKKRDDIPADVLSRVRGYLAEVKRTEIGGKAKEGRALAQQTVRMPTTASWPDKLP